MEQKSLFPYQVFISYAKEDKKSAIEFYNELTKHGIISWIDLKDLNPGANWDLSIDRAIKQCPYIIVLLSNNSIAKKGYIQKEIKKALDVADTIPDDNIYILPVRLEPCKVPDRLTKWQWSDFYDPQEKQKLFQFLKKCLGITNFQYWGRTTAYYCKYKRLSKLGSDPIFSLLLLKLRAQIGFIPGLEAPFWV